MQQERTPAESREPARSGQASEPGSTTGRIFISYSRKDTKAAEDVLAALTARAFEPFLDTKQIAPGEDWKERLSALILTADAVVFLISPDSVRSDVCDWELNETERLGKRLIPVVCRATQDDLIPSRLRRLNWIDLTDPALAGPRLEALSAALMTDIGWVREHTRVGELADRWANKASREERSLLRGRDIEEAELWISSQPRNAPEITELQRTFISESRRAEQQRARLEREQVERIRRFQKRSAWALAAVAGLMVAGAVVTAWQYHATSLRESNVLASIADKAFQDGYCDRALRYAVAGLPPRGATPLIAGNADLELALLRYASACRLEFAVSSPEMVRKNRGIGGANPVDVMIHRTRPIEVVFSPDGKRVAILLGDDIIRIVDTAGRDLGLVRRAKISDVAFSPDGGTLFTRAVLDNTVRLFDVVSGQERAALVGSGKSLSAMTVSPDGKLVALAGDDFVIRLWSVTPPREIATFAGHTEAVRQVAFSPDGRMLLSLPGKSEVPRVWDVESGRMLSELAGHGREVRDGAFSPDGKLIATASEDATVRIWSVPGGELIHTLVGHAGIVGHVAFSPDGSRLASGALAALAGARDTSVRVWDVRDGRQLQLLSGHTGTIEGLSFSPDGKRLLTASHDRTARLWDVDSGAEVALYKGHVDEIRAVALSPDGQHIATASLDGTARFWSADLSKGNVTVEGTLARRPETALSLDGSRLITIVADNSAAVWDTSTGAKLSSLLGHTKPIVSAAFSRDGRQVATGSQDGTARVFDAARGNVIAVLEGHGDAIKSVAFSPDGRQLLTVTDDGIARLWDVARRVVAFLRERTDEKVAHAQFVPGSGEIMTSAYQQGVKIWNANGDRVSDRLALPQQNNNSFLSNGAVETFIAPDGRTTIVEWFNLPSVYVIYEQRKPVRQLSLGIGARPVFRFDVGSLKVIIRPLISNTAKIVDLTSGQEIATLRGHSNAMTGATFSPDGRFVVTDSRDHTIRLWDVTTGAEIGRLPDDRERGLPPIFTPNGKRLVVESIDAQRTMLLNLDPVNFVPADMRRDYVCRERLSGADTFSDAEMEDPVLRNREDLRNPCRAFGPLSLEFYADVLGMGRH
jgi:WD40 repeat protein